MLKSLFFTCFTIGCLFSLHGQINGTDFHPPLAIPLRLSANFGELRSNHFHMGLDFKTYKREGYPIYAIDEGYISRVRVSPYGYGKVVYINHPNGISSVYAHCSHFNPQIDSLVYAIQVEHEANEIDVYLTPNEMNISRGEIVAFSGNTGHSQGPHLHFEIRNTATQKALNPLLFGFEIEDHISPEITSMRIYGLSEEGYNIPGKINKVELPQKNNDQIIYSDTILIPSNFLCEEGSLGFSFEMRDKFDGESNLCGIYGTRLEIDDQLLFCGALDSIDFTDSRYINSHMDYSAFTNEKRHFQKTYKTAVNPLEIYPCELKGILKIEANKVYHSIFSSNDIVKNETVLHFKFRADSSSFRACNDLFKSEHYLFPDSSYFLENEKIRFNISKYTFYEPVLKNLSLNLPYSLGDANQSIQKAIEVSIVSPESNSDSYYIQVLNAAGIKKALKSINLNGWITAESEYMGIFSLQRDLTPPSISAFNFRIKDQKITKNEILWQIQEGTTSLKSYDLYVDGIWKPVYFDNKSNTISFIVEKTLKGNHHFKVTASDQCNNEQVWEATLNFE
jgi:hypothetical protein